MERRRAFRIGLAEQEQSPRSPPAPKGPASPRGGAFYFPEYSKACGNDGCRLSLPIEGVIMGRADDYLRNAKDAQDWADRASTQQDREGWLKIARGWVSLVRRSSSFPDFRSHTGEHSSEASPSQDRSTSDR